MSDSMKLLIVSDNVNQFNLEAKISKRNELKEEILAESKDLTVDFKYYLDLNDYYLKRLGIINQPIEQIMFELFILENLKSGNLKNINNLFDNYEFYEMVV